MEACRNRLSFPDLSATVPQVWSAVTAPDASKAGLRERMLRVRAAIPEEERRHRAARVEARVLALAEVEQAGTVLLFYSFGAEVETAVLLRRLHERGKRLLLPYLEGGRIEAAEVRPGDPLAPTGYGPREPARRVPVDPAEVDLVITPGLAFDRRGYRLGHGAAHYDRFLKRLRPAAVRVGIGFAEQLLDELPTESHDEALHLVVTDAEVVDLR
jgi:5-formyltetrahydrofolate cyclo-ligase